jgi:hypothetical protein
MRGTKKEWAPTVEAAEARRNPDQAISAKADLGRDHSGG